MLKILRFGTQNKRRLIIQFALLCFLALHAIAAVHKHVTAVELHACLACQLVDHEPLNSPGEAPSLILIVLAAFLVAQPNALGIVSSLELFERPRSRAPPL